MVLSKYSLKNIITKTILYMLLILVGVVMIVPFLWMISASFKYNREIFVYPIQWIPEIFRFSNYKEVWTKIPFLKYYLNTLKSAVVITLGQLITCSLAAYSFSKLHYRGRDKLFLIYLATMMVPWQAIMIPQFNIINTLGLFGTSWAIILLQVFNPFGVFLLRQSMLSIPNELSQAARIDGCNEFMIYYKIIIPLTKAGLAALTIFTFTFVWNDYLGPLIYLDSDNLKTIQLGLTYFRTQYSAEYGLIMAGTVCSLVPLILIYCLAQKYLIDGIAFSGLKG